MNALEVVKSHLCPGQVYRRADFEKWSNAVDRHLSQLRQEKMLTKLSGGLYYCPKENSFGKAPPQDHELVEVFLKDTRFLILTYDAYNTLGVGTTQLYNETVVYNHKRHGVFKIGSRTFRFVMKHHFPPQLSDEFLLVDLVDSLNKLAEDRSSILGHIKAKVLSMDQKALQEAVKEYGGAKARKFFSFLGEGSPYDA